MTIKSFIPTIWSARLLRHLDNKHVYAGLCNKDYEGEISAQGNTVKVNKIGAVTINKYDADGQLKAPEGLTTTALQMVIDQGDYFNFSINDIDAIQGKAPLMNSAMERASYGMSEVTDKFLANLMTTEAGIKIGTDSAPIAFTGENAYTALVKIKVKMDKSNIQSTGRFLVAPPDLEGMLLLDKRFIPAGAEELKSGFIGRCAGFDIYTSNNVPVTGDKYKLSAGVLESTSFAEQISEIEAYRPETAFADAMKGLHIYGGKVFESESLACVIATFAEFAEPVALKTK